ncbi:hypothetical protein HAX54_032134 [Datura stramonium]|uniref:Peptidase A1 domain-containing protein n=1 Tax=Datura stramonium TaxID=4076 RepID=A0ABS8SCG2_DATST|nr:hypothetical protein [Datura stramonium]
MSIDPTKLPDPPMPSYTFTIYNRDLFEKSKFKNYDSLLERRLARCQARANYLASILENDNVHENKRAREKVPKTTSTQFVNVFINDKEIPLNPSLSTWNFGNDMTGGCIVDTGTTITRFPQDFYSVFRDTFRKEVRDIPMVNVPPGSFDTCYKDDPSAQEPNFPVVKLYFGHKKPENLLLLEQQRVVVHFAGMYCLGFMAWNQSLALLGGAQLQGIGLTFDTSKNTLSFDLDVCD